MDVSAPSCSIAASKDGSADKFLAKCLRQNPLGLPDFMFDATNQVIRGHEVLEEAVAYMQNLQVPLRTADVSHRLECESALELLRANLREQVYVTLEMSSDDLSWDDFFAACKAIDSHAECRGLPYAALLSENSDQRHFLWQLHRLALKLGMSAKLWTTQDLYHVLKPSRNPQALSSFRILGLNAAQGRLQEEIWAQLQPKLWMHTGSFQEGRSECLMVVASDLCVIQMRSALGLPSSMVLVDRQEAFDSQWRPSMLLPLAKLVPPRLWCVMDELHKNTSMSIVSGCNRSSPFTTKVGVVQGRKLSPLAFCIGQSALESAANEALAGLGMNPPIEAVVAFHANKDGSEDGGYDKHEALRLLGEVQSGLISWSSAMQRASSDTVRLILLDAASTVSRGVRSFVDDTRIPISCHGHAVALQVLDGQASKEQYRYKSDKCKVIAHNFGQRRPIPLQDGHVQYSQSAVQLACSVDVLFDGSAHLSAILAKGSHKFPVLLGQMVSMKLPMLALLRAVRVRMIPAVMFGVELVVNVPFFLRNFLTGCKPDGCVACLALVRQYPVLS